jgi:hypothetical protein
VWPGTDPDGADHPGPRPRTGRPEAGEPRRREVPDAHEAAVAAGESGYLDPVSGLFVLTSAHLAARGVCCGQGCRHCPYPGPPG